jgi:mono/diheme cytochrome c family protein
MSAVMACLCATTHAADQLTPLEAQGKQVYAHWCIYCHAPGVWGTNRLSRRLDKDHAVLENRTDLTAPGVRAVIRTGIGSMPPLRRTEVSDADVDAIAAYLTRQRSQQ